MLDDPNTRRLYRLYIDAKKDSAAKVLAEGILELGTRLAKLEFHRGEHRECDLRKPCVDKRHQFDDDDWRYYVDQELKKT